MRKVFLALVLLALIVVPVTAKSTFAAGVNLGTNMGAGLQFQVDDFDIVANVGYNLLSSGYLSVDAAASYTATSFDVGSARIDVTAGLGAAAGFAFTTGTKPSVAAIAPIGLKYSLDNNDVPLDFYLRVSPGLQILPKIGFAWGANLAVLWRFN
jgi:hypothetical protein